VTARRRWIWIISFVAGIFFCVGFLASFQLPKVRSWALVQINEVSETSLPVRILPRDLKLHFFPLGATLEQVRILPKDELKAILDPLTIEQLTIEISAFQLLQGRLRIRDLLVRGAQVNLRLPKTEKSDEPPLKGVFDLLQTLPLNRLEIAEIDLNLSNAEPNFHAELSGLSASAENLRRRLILTLATGSTRLRDQGTKASVRIELETRVLLAREGVTLSEFKLRRGDSFIVASGIFKGDTEALKFSEMQLDARTSLHIESMRNWLVKNIPKMAKLPVLKGRAHAEARIRGNPNEIPDVQFSFETDGLYESKIFFDRLTGKGSLNKQGINLSRFELINPGAHASASNVQIKWPTKSGPPTSATTLRLEAELLRFDLHTFLKNLGLNEVPVWAEAQGKLPCEGTLQPKFELTCRGSIEGKDAIVHETKRVKGSIVAIPSFSATGEVSVDSQAVRYKAELKMPNSRGRSSGLINYENGFRIDYEADQLDFADKANLADLKLEGLAQIKGFTEGNSESAIMSLQLNGKNLWFEDYGLGNINTQINYKSGKLIFSNASGSFSVSRYTGDLSIDLRKKLIEAKLQVPFYEASDLLQAFSRKAKLPVAVTGTGSARIDVTGPLEFTKLTYTLRSSLFRGFIAGESFDSIHFDVSAKSGHVQIDRAGLKRGDANIVMTGTGSPDGTIKTNLRGQGWRIEDSTHMRAKNINLSGVVGFSMDLVGPVLSPNTDMRGNIRNAAIGDQAVDDSEFRLRFRETTIEGGGRFLGEAVSADFVIPLNPQAPFRLKMKTDNWNFAPVFMALAGPGVRRDYEGRLISEIDLSSESGGFWRSSGRIHIGEFVLRRGALQMRAPQPIKLSLESGRVGVENFLIEGDGTFLRIVDAPQTDQPISLQANGKLDLSLLALLTPFLEELRGLVSFTFNLQGGEKQFALLGSAYIDKGFLKLFDFPHPFEDVRADLLFSQKKILINSLRSDFARGRLTADGQIELKGYKNYPLQISAVAERLNLNIPAGISTQGSGRLAVSGSWFPFLIKGQYEIRSGLVSQLGEAESGTKPGLQRSAFLPRVILEDSFTPIELDLEINIPQPIEIKAAVPVIELAVDGRASGRLNIKGPPQKLSLLGSVSTDRESKVVFRDNTFELTAGVVNFTDPLEINPNLYITARSRVSDHDINLVYQGTLNKPDLVLTSSPPLPESDIISLLAFGRPGQQFESMTSGNQALSGLSITGGLIKNNPATSQFKKATGIDVSASISDVNNAAVPKITASRRFTPKFSVSASQSIGNSRRSEGRAQYQLSRGLSIVGSWEGQERQEGIDTSAQTRENQDTFGLDIEYKFEFK